MEAKEKAKLHIKQMEVQRKENAKRGITGVSGPKFASGGGSGSYSPSSVTPSLDSSAGGGYGSGSLSRGSSSSYAAAAPVAAAPARGMQLGAKKNTTNDFLEAMKLEEGKGERRYEIIGIEIESPQSAQSAASSSKASAVQAPVEKTEAVHVVVEEKLIVISNRDGGLENLEVKGKKTQRNEIDI